MSRSGVGDLPNAQERNLASIQAQADLIRMSVRSELSVSEPELKARLLARVVEDSAKSWPIPPTDEQVTSTIDQCWSDIEALYTASVVSAMEEDARYSTGQRSTCVGLAMPCLSLPFRRSSTRASKICAGVGLSS